MKRFQLIRLTHTDKHWPNSGVLCEHAFQLDVNALHTLLNRIREEIDVAENHTQSILVEAKLAKALYKMVSQTVGYGGSTRVERGDGIDMANRFLGQGNYLVYGLAAMATRATGIPHGLAAVHGKTHRGGLAFDPADLVKDALITSQASIAIIAGEDAQEFRQRCVNIFQQANTLDVMVTSLRGTAQVLAKADQ